MIIIKDNNDCISFCFFTHDMTSGVLRHIKRRSWESWKELLKADMVLFCERGFAGEEMEGRKGGTAVNKKL